MPNSPEPQQCMYPGCTHTTRYLSDMEVEWGVVFCDIDVGPDEKKDPKDHAVLPRHWRQLKEFLDNKDHEGLKAWLKEIGVPWKGMPEPPCASCDGLAQDGDYLCESCRQIS